MKKRDYDTKDSYTGGTDTHVAVDTKMRQVIEDGSSEGDREAFQEGFASASGIRSETAETGGRIKNPENKDAARPGSEPKVTSKENSGLADN